MDTKKDVYLVIGGSGFVGRHIVEALLARGDSVSVFDIVQRYHDTPFYSGDISEEGSISDALRKSGATCIIHTASPMHGVKDDALYWRVNVDGTKAVIDAAIACGVPKLVFTSSAGVVFSGADLINIDERAPAPERALDAYNESKATAEALVLAANGKNGLLTVALRPAGIFGPGDRQVMAGFGQVYERRQTHFQIGDNTNMFDWTYVGNVAHAHLLAADRLVAPTVSYPAPVPAGQPAPEVDAAALEKLAQSQRHMVASPLPPIGGSRRIPTSNARPIGPAVEPPPNAAELEAAFHAPPDVKNSGRPVWHNRFDPLSENSLARAAARGENPLQVAGQAFFVTNGEPLYFWDFPRLVWHKLAQAESTPPPKKSTIRFPRELGMVLATAAEWWGWLSGKEPAFTRFRVSFSCVNRWHNIEKARRVLGYEPVVSLEEGVDKMVEWWLKEHAPTKA